MTKEYDRYFKLYTLCYFDGLVSWAWFKAQAIAESNLDPDAVSPKGARGIMQIMPSTAKDIARDLRLHKPSIFDPKTNILMGICYARKMWDIFGKEHGLERLRFAFGAYNAGAGNIIDAQEEAVRQGHPPDRWLSICNALPEVTGDDDAPETINYVRKIERIRMDMIEA